MLVYKIGEKTLYTVEFSFREAARGRIMSVLVLAENTEKAFNLAWEHWKKEFPSLPGRSEVKEEVNLKLLLIE